LSSLSSPTFRWCLVNWSPNVSVWLFGEVRDADCLPDEPA
jgi:hypothetical protein